MKFFPRGVPLALWAATVWLGAGLAQERPLQESLARVSPTSGPLEKSNLTPPPIGTPEILKISEIKPGMQAIAWTVFEGGVPEPVPVEIIGLWKNTWGPGQDVIIAKMGGKAIRTNVAGGMSGSPVYVDGKLIGAVALRLSVFSPDAICGITPIELMLDINGFDQTRPTDARTPDSANTVAALPIPGRLLPPSVMSGASAFPAGSAPRLTPIETPLIFSGFDDAAVRAFAPTFQQLGIESVAGGAGGSLRGSKPVQGWQTALRPGAAIAGVLVSGDMSVTGLGTVTYNDGKHVLAFGHPFFNLGPVDMPMSGGEILTVLASTYQPNKLGNATEIVGALHQDRHSGIMGVLGDEAPMIPVRVTVRSLGEDNQPARIKEFQFHVFQHQKWTPYLMTMTLFNSISGLNEFREEATYRLTGTVNTKGGNLSLNNMQTSGETQLPAPMILAGWWGEKFNRLFLNPVDTPSLTNVDVTIDLLPERRSATLEGAFIPPGDYSPGDEIPVKAFLRPFRGPRIERDFKVKIPDSLPRGDHRLVIADADIANRLQNPSGGRHSNVQQTIALINQERTNTNLYVSLLSSAPTGFVDDKILPDLPASVLGVMAGHASGGTLVLEPETVAQQVAVPFDLVVSGVSTLKISVK